MKTRTQKISKNFPATLTMSIQQDQVEQAEKKETKKDDEVIPLKKEEIEAMKAYSMGLCYSILRLNSHLRSICCVM